MKIEKINENQIKCTLTKEDLYARQLKISELAYGSDKVKDLFIEICKKAFVECDFEADGTPLMIEAIPLSADSLVLVMTKVNDPEELDARFSHFTAPPEESNDPIISPEERVYADEIINCMEHLNKLLTDPIASKIFSTDGAEAGEELVASVPITRMFTFCSLDEVIGVSKVIGKVYKGKNSLYKDRERGLYYLIMAMSEHTPVEFNKICNMMTEYIVADQPYHALSEDYVREHCERIIIDKAVQVLRKM